ncbi:isopropylmalate isomerase [Ferroacidibacillus organovorans]|nr:3-isopropylmalate dehydratase small subunit [Ferroacidibacillus organovorans]OAG95221.1 isopropylmalate isomerase [Ferroacidibacillus organovorans]
MPRANIDTDAIIPKQFLKRIERTGFGQYLFYDWRFDEREKPNPDFILNQEPHCYATVLVAGPNFGCGSSREHAPWALLDFGFRVVIAPSFADIFYNNCFKNGVLPIVLPEDAVSSILAQASEAPLELTIDLAGQRVSLQSGETHNFSIDPYRKHLMMEGLDDIGLTMKHEDAITTYEISAPFAVSITS